MLTWTTYGTWLQGDKKGYVKNGKIYGENESLRKCNLSKMKTRKFVLGTQAQNIVKQSILEEADKMVQQVYASSVSATHVHIVVNNTDEMISDVISRYKKTATKKLRAAGFTGEVWTRGYDVRYCFDEKELHSRVEYVNRHERS